MAISTQQAKPNMEMQMTSRGARESTFRLHSLKRTAARAPKFSTSRLQQRPFRAVPISTRKFSLLIALKVHKTKSEVVVCNIILCINKIEGYGCNSFLMENLLPFEIYKIDQSFIKGCRK